MNRFRPYPALLAAAFLFGRTALLAQQVGASAPAPLEPPSIALALLRLVGALAIVLALFYGGVWAYRHWQRASVLKGHTPRLNILEARSLGSRHALYVVGYDHQRLLLSSSPSGVTLVSHLPPEDADGSEPVATIPDQAAETAAPSPRPVFAASLQRWMGV